MRDRLQIPTIQTIEDLANSLREQRCTRCRLGSQPGLKGHAVYRGHPGAPLFFIGEAPGKEEDRLGIPFTGPAGGLLDKMIVGMGLKQEDYLITNVCFCRPIAPPGSGKQNDTPVEEELQACRPYITWILKQHKPRIAILLGKPAISTLLPHVQVKSVGSVVYKFYLSDEFPGTLFTAMYHPAFLLRKQYTDNWQTYRKATWEHLLQVKKVLEEEHD